MPRILLHRYLFTVLALSCHLRGCVSDCEGVKASRKNLYIPEGGSVSLSCDVVHCQQKWTGGWGVYQERFTLLSPSPRVHLSNTTIEPNTTRLFLNIHNLNQSDSGVYQCNINWENSSSQGHVTHLNVTERSSDHILPDPTGRKLHYRLLVCAAASLCFPLALALAFRFSLNRRPAPPVPPPRSRNSCTARVQPNTDVVYSLLTLNPQRQQSTPQAKMATEGITYATVNFSNA